MNVFNIEHQKKPKQTNKKNHQTEGAADIKAALWCSDKAFELLEMKHVLNIKQRISRRKF